MEHMLFTYMNLGTLPIPQTGAFPLKVIIIPMERHTGALTLSIDTWETLETLKQTKMESPNSNWISHIFNWQVITLSWAAAALCISTLMTTAWVIQKNLIRPEAPAQESAVELQAERKHQKGLLLNDYEDIRVDETNQFIDSFNI